MPLGPYQAAINYTTIIGSVLEHLQRNEIEHARALCCLGLCASEQVALDNGNWTLGFLMTLLPEPSYSLISQHKPNPSSWSPHAKIAEESWVAGHLAYLRDADMVSERRRKFVKGGKEEDPSKAGQKQGGGWKGNKGKEKDKPAP
jgi:hypothetical protein